jgi:hypothetical protein
MMLFRALPGRLVESDRFCRGRFVAKRLRSLDNRFLKVTQKMFPVGKQTWVLDLCRHLDPLTLACPGVDESDEPPLFTRTRQVRFFADVPLATSGPIVLRAPLNIPRDIAKVIDSADMPDSQVYSASVTLMDWDDIDETCPVPTPSVLVNPTASLDLLGMS